VKLLRFVALALILWGGFLALVVGPAGFVMVLGGLVLAATTVTVS
jgi:hypothetical protein